MPAAISAAGLPGGAWFAASKDHLQLDPHVVKAYAIGLKIFNQVNGQKVAWTAGTLASKMSLTVADSSTSSFPSLTVGVPNQHLLVGGGGTVSYAGNGVMLTASFPPSSTGWAVSGKAHISADAGKASAYVISIPQCPANLAYCLTNSVGSAINTTGFGGQSTLVWNASAQFAITSAGAGANSNNQVNLAGGRMLNAIYPAGPSNGLVLGSSKDHIVSESGSTTAFYVGLKRQ